jgi:hypothetical protein
MEATRKPLAKIEGRKRMQVSGLTVAWHGTRSRKDWVAYVENGSEAGRLVLADQVSERAVKSLLARAQNLSREELEALCRPAEAAAQPGDGPSTPGTEMALPSRPSGQLALAGDGDGRAPAAERVRQRRVTGTVESTEPPAGRKALRASARDLAGTVRQLRSRLEHLEQEQEQLRAELAGLRGEAEPYDGPPSIFTTGWFRATLVLIVLAIVVVISVPWLMDVFDGGSRETRSPARTEAPTPAASVTTTR